MSVVDIDKLDIDNRTLPEEVELYVGMNSISKDCKR